MKHFDESRKNDYRNAFALYLCDMADKIAASGNNVHVVGLYSNIDAFVLRIERSLLLDLEAYLDAKVGSAAGDAVFKLRETKRFTGRRGL